MISYKRIAFIGFILFLLISIISIVHAQPILQEYDIANPTIVYASYIGQYINGFEFQAGVTGENKSYYLSHIDILLGRNPDSDLLSNTRFSISQDDCEHPMIEDTMHINPIHTGEYISWIPSIPIYINKTHKYCVLVDYRDVSPYLWIFADTGYTYNSGDTSSYHYISSFDDVTYNYWDNGHPPMNFKVYEQPVPIFHLNTTIINNSFIFNDTYNFLIFGTNNLVDIFNCTFNINNTLYYANINLTSVSLYQTDLTNVFGYFNITIDCNSLFQTDNLNYILIKGNIINNFPNSQQILVDTINNTGKTLIFLLLLILSAIMLIWNYYKMKIPIIEFIFTIIPFILISIFNGLDEKVISLFSFLIAVYGFFTWIKLIKEEKKRIHYAS